MNKLNILSLNPESIKIYYRIRYLIKLKLAKTGTKFDINDLDEKLIRKYQIKTFVPMYVYKFDFTDFDNAFEIFSKHFIHHSQEAIERFTKHFIDNNIDNRRDIFRD